jgi:membrane fusion protein, multidrug efflux system
MKLMKPYIFTAVVLLLLSCSKNKGKEIQEKENPLPAIVIQPSIVKKEIVLPGEIIPFEKVKIFPKVNGFIQKLSVDIGSEVKKGDVLVLLEAPELKAQSEEAYSKLQSAKSKWEGSKDTYLRTLSSSKTPGIISPNDLEKAKAIVLADSTNFLAALSNYESSKNISRYLVIKSPFDGVITNRNEHPGALVGPNNSTPILELENNHVLRLRVAVPEIAVGNILTDRIINFKLKSYPGQFFKATLARKAEALNVNTRSEIWEFEIDNKDKKVKSGMYAEVKLELERPKNSFLLPNSSVVTSLEQTFVIRVQKDTLQWVNVEKGISFPDKVEVFGLLKEKDIILKSGSEELKPGKRIIYKIEQ